MIKKELTSCPTKCQGDLLGRQRIDPGSTFVLTFNSEDSPSIYAPICEKPGYVCKRWAKNKIYIYYYFKHKENGKIKWCYLGKTTREKSLEETINSIKEEVYSKAGTIKYKCECGKITEYLDLILTGGKCPKCRAVLIKFSNCLA